MDEEEKEIDNGDICDSESDAESSDGDADDVNETVDEVNKLDSFYHIGYEFAIYRFLFLSGDNVCLQKYL